MFQRVIISISNNQSLLHSICRYKILLDFQFPYKLKKFQEIEYFILFRVLLIQSLFHIDIHSMQIDIALGIKIKILFENDISHKMH